MPKTPYRLRRRNLFDAASPKPFRLSRSKLELFIQCARCFYLDRKLGLSRPEGPPFTLNNAVDLLLKREFDHYRARGLPHPCTLQMGEPMIPLAHPELDRWRDALHGGLVYRDPHHPREISGAIDDIWVNSSGRWVVVDYKATGSSYGPVAYSEYRRQLSLYGWLLEKLGAPVAQRGVLLYACAQITRDRFDQALNFDLTQVPVELHSGRIETLIAAAWRCLEAAVPPSAEPCCPWCGYANARALLEDAKIAGAPD